MARPRNPLSFFARLKRMVKNVRRGDRLCWTDIAESFRRAFRGKRIRRSPAGKRLLACQVGPWIARGLVASPCDDADVAARLVDFCGRLLAFLEMEARARHMEVYRDQLPSVDWVLAPVLEAGAAWTFSGSHLVEAVNMAMSSGNYDFFAVVFFYGFWDASMLDKEWVTKFTFYETCHSLCFSRANAGHEAGMEGESSFWRRFAARNAAWQDLRENGGRMLGQNRRGFRRIALLCRTLQCLPAAGHAHRRPECLRLFMSLQPDPFVTADELREFLEYLMRDDNARPLVDYHVERFAATFGRLPYEPRSLVHLSRNAVRVALAKRRSCVLHKAVEQLPITHVMKEFVLGVCQVPIV